MKLQSAEEIIAYISNSVKKTPVKVYVKGKISELSFPECVQAFTEEKTGIECEIISSENLSEAMPLDYDMIYVGAGTEKAQKRALSDIVPNAQELKKAADIGTVILFTGNAFEMLGKKIKSAKGEEYQCLGFFDFETEETAKRITGDAVCENVFSEKLTFCKELKDLLTDNLTIGFVNKCTNLDKMF